MRLDYRTLLFKDTWLTLAPRYNYYYSIDDAVTDRGLRPRGSAGIATLRAGVETATKVYVGEREFFAGVFGRGTELFGDKSNQFGFQRLGEIGGTLRLDYPVDAGVGIGAYASLIRGSGVTGHTLGITLTFGHLGWRSARRGDPMTVGVHRVEASSHQTDSTHRVARDTPVDGPDVTLKINIFHNHA